MPIVEQSNRPLEEELFGQFDEDDPSTYGLWEEQCREVCPGCGESWRNHVGYSILGPNKCEKYSGKKLTKKEKQNAQTNER